jgi:hypothetical protein
MFGLTGLVYMHGGVSSTKQQHEVVGELGSKNVFSNQDGLHGMSKKRWAS